MLVIYTKRWWIESRDRSRVRNALIKVDSEHILSCMNRVVKRNKESGTGPQTFSEIAERLHRDYRVLWRITSGRSSPKLEDFQTLASILNVDPGDLILPADTRLMLATM